MSGASTKGTKDLPCVCLRVQILSIDFRMIIPNETVDVCQIPDVSAGGAAQIDFVPVIRIFGATPVGQNVCLHVHQVFPYLFIPYVGPLDPDECLQYRQRLHTSLNQALELAYGGKYMKNNTGENPLPSAHDRRLQHVLQVELVRGNQLYGFSPHEKLFLKISMLNPTRMKKTAMLLQSGAVMATQFQPHEAHVPYILQFLIDYNLYGMDNIDLSCALFRSPMPEPHLTPSNSQLAFLDVRASPVPAQLLTGSNGGRHHFTFNRQTVLTPLMWPKGSPLSEKESFCELEADTVAAAILNRYQISITSQPATAAFDTSNAQKKLVRSLSDIWEDEIKRRVQQGRSANFTQELSQERLVTSPVSHNTRWTSMFESLFHGDHPNANNHVVNPEPNSAENNEAPLNVNVAGRSESLKDFKSAHEQRMKSSVDFEEMLADDPWGDDDLNMQLPEEDMINPNEWKRPQAHPSTGPLPPTNEVQPLSSVVDKETIMEGLPVSQWNETSGASPLKLDQKDAHHRDKRHKQDKTDAIPLPTLRLAQQPMWNSINSPPQRLDSDTVVSQSGSTPTLSRAVGSVEKTPQRVVPGLLDVPPLRWISESPNGNEGKSLRQVSDDSVVDEARVRATQVMEEQDQADEREALAILAKFHADNIEYAAQAQLTMLSPKQDVIENDEPTELREPASILIDPMEQQANEIANLLDGLDPDEFWYQPTPPAPRKPSSQLSPSSSQRRLDRSLAVKLSQVFSQENFETATTAINNYDVDRTHQKDETFHADATSPNLIRAAELGVSPKQQALLHETCQFSPSVLRHLLKITSEDDFSFDGILAKSRALSDDYSKPANREHQQTPKVNFKIPQWDGAASTSSMPASLKSDIMQFDGANDDDSQITVSRRSHKRSIVSSSPATSPVQKLNSLATFDSSPQAKQSPEKQTSLSNQDDIKASSAAARIEQYERQHWQPSPKDRERLNRCHGLVSDIVTPLDQDEVATTPFSFDFRLLWSPYACPSNPQELEVLSIDPLSLDTEVASTHEPNLLESHPIPSKEQVNEETTSSLIEFKQPLDKHEIPSHCTVLKYCLPPPLNTEMIENIGVKYGLPTVVYQEPFFSNAADIPSRQRVFAGRGYTFKPQTVSNLPEADPDAVLANAGLPQDRCWRKLKVNLGIPRGNRILRYVHQPPRISLVAAGDIINQDDDSDSDDHGDIDRQEQRPSSPSGPSFMISLPSQPSATKQKPSKPGPFSKLDQVHAAAKVERAATLQEPPDKKQNNSGAHLVSQIEGATPRNLYGFKFNPVSAATTAAATELLFQKQHLRVLSVDFHVNTRGSLLPDPTYDAVQAIFYCLQDERLAVHSPATALPGAYHQGYYPGYITVHNLEEPDPPTSFVGVSGFQVQVVDSESNLFDAFIKIIRLMDPDVLTGFELQKGSWGYLVDRATRACKINLPLELSRVQPAFTGLDGFEDSDGYNYRQNSGLHVTGRIVINQWRVFRMELPLNVYSFENVVYHVLHERIPHNPHQTLTKQWTGGRLTRWRVLRYYLDRVQKVLQISDELDIVGRTSEFARVFGIDFSSVLSRGSQYRVESMMLRLAKQENFVAFSPSKAQVENQRAPECIPLVMEPESRFYSSPVVVLDFQSLYPSIMIAYNYCFSTCLGRVPAPNDPQRTQIGVANISVPKELLENLKDDIDISPNGIMFVKPNVRKGVLPRMLTEILDTRVMIKKSLKHNKGNQVLSWMLDARQLGLKLIANVTYGYTAASFSGRMPCADVADSIVLMARKTLEKAIRVIESEFKGSKVVYGDTDSLFVHLPGATREAAFRIGKAISKRITMLNPKPIKLKFEKVYHPCVLLSKKRYVGYMYESLEDKEPKFDAKGIETVRRDSCPVVAKMLEKTIKILFRSQDLSEIKEYMQRQWSKILNGRISIQDCVFSKEVRLGTYSNRGVLPPAALVATHKMTTDPRAEPRFGERVRYVVVYGGPRSRLTDLVVSPEQLLHDKSLRLHGAYYITKQIIPAIGRVLNLVGADLLAWYAELPRVYRATVLPPEPSEHRPTKRGNVIGVKTIDRFYASSHCMLCQQLTNEALCQKCKSNPQTTTYQALLMIKDTERTNLRLSEICFSCTGAVEDVISCVSLDCPIYYERLKTQRHLDHLGVLREAVKLLNA